MRRYWWLVPVVALLAIPLVFLLRGFVGEVLVPGLMRLVWSLGLVLDSFPQTPVWWLFLGLVAFLALRSLFGGFRMGEKPPERKTEAPGAVHHLTARIERAREGDYFRWNLSRHLGAIALNVLAHKQHTSTQILKKHLESDQLDAPPEIVDYLRAGQAPIYVLAAGRFARLGHLLSAGVESDPLEEDLEVLVRYLEDQLEVVDDR